jgi:hypothetical protein
MCKTTVLKVNLSEEDKAMLHSIAKTQRLSLSAWALAVLMREVRKSNGKPEV